MKSKLFLMVLCALVFLGTNVSAQDNPNRVTVTGNATSSIRIDNRKDTTSSDDKGRGEEMRSEVATAVHRLLRVADRNGNLGEEVRKIAGEQASSTEVVSKAKEKVESRNGLKTFLIGTDYKNLGAIRSEMVKTESRIEKLKREAEKMIEWDQDLINSEIAILEEDLSNLNKFIEDNEGRFSLFGWVAKLLQ